MIMNGTVLAACLHACVAVQPVNGVEIINSLMYAYIAQPQPQAQPKPQSLYAELVQELTAAGIRVDVAKPRDLAAFANAGRGISKDRVAAIIRLDASSDSKIPEVDISAAGIIGLPHVAPMRAVGDIMLSQLAVSAEMGDAADVLHWSRKIAVLHLHGSKQRFMVEAQFCTTLLQSFVDVISASGMVAKVAEKDREQLSLIATALRKQHLEAVRTGLRGERDYVVSRIKLDDSVAYPLSKSAWRQVRNRQLKTVNEVTRLYDLAISEVAEGAIDVARTKEAIDSTPVDTAKYFTSYVPAFLERSAQALAAVDQLLKALK